MRSVLNDTMSDAEKNLPGPTKRNKSNNPNNLQTVLAV